MEVRKRQALPHLVPMWVDPQKEIYFITVNCQSRFTNQLALPKIAEQIFETVRHRQERFFWWPHLFLLMPDHIHALLSFPPSGKRLSSVIRKWKEWTSKDLGIHWQRDYFEHRMRNDESRRQKADYILQNPHRRNLVGRDETWPYVYFGAGQPPEFG
jgi:putative transposase